MFTLSVSELGVGDSSTPRSRRRFSERRRVIVRTSSFEAEAEEAMGEGGEVLRRGDP